MSIFSSLKYDPALPASSSSDLKRRLFRKKSAIIYLLPFSFVDYNISLNEACHPDNGKVFRTPTRPHTFRKHIYRLILSYDFLYVNWFQIKQK